MYEENERFLDRLVVEVADLEFLKKRQEHERTLYFLSLSYGVKDVYIQKTVEIRLPINELPDGNLYVFTPDEGFGYSKSTQEDGTLKIDELPNGYYSEGTLEETISKIIERAKRAASNQKPNSIWAFFYDYPSKQIVSEILMQSGFHLMEIRSLNVPGFGIVKSYRYVD